MVLSGSERETFLQSYVYKLINTYNNNNNNNNTRNDTTISDVTAGNPTRFTGDSSSGSGVGFTDTGSGDSGRKWNFLGSDTPDTKAGTSGLKRPPSVTVYFTVIHMLILTAYA